MPEGNTTEPGPTKSLEAYEAYLAGLNQPLEDAIVSFSRAVELDPDFLQARLELAEAHAWTEFMGRGTATEGWQVARHALDRAQALAPDAPQLHRALAQYHYTRRDYVRALEAIEVAEAALPSDDDLLRIKGFVLRRQGRFAEAVLAWHRAFVLNPREVLYPDVIAEALTMLRDYPRAREWVRRVRVLDPAEWAVSTLEARMHWLEGNLPAARLALDSIPEPSDPTAAQSDVGAWLDWMWFWQHIYERRFREALTRIADGPEWLAVNLATVPRSLLTAFAHEQLGDRETALEDYARAARMLETKLEASPDDPRLHASLGWAWAGSGNPEAALREGRQAVRLVSVDEDAVSGPLFVLELARIDTMLGEDAAAVDRLEYLLSIPALVTERLLELDPTWDTLRRDPRFRGILETER